VIAFIAEPVVGATAGAVPPTPGYFAGVRALLRSSRHLFHRDEVMCRHGSHRHAARSRAGRRGADLMTRRQGAWGGYQPDRRGAGGRQDRGGDPRRQRLFHTATTYIGHPVAAAAALAVQQVIERNHLLARVRDRGAYLRRLLVERLGGHENVGDIGGRGLFMGVELVSDRATKAPFDPTLALHAQGQGAGRWPMACRLPDGGTIDGRYGDHVLLAPPFHRPANPTSTGSSTFLPCPSTKRSRDSAAPDRSPSAVQGTLMNRFLRSTLLRHWIASSVSIACLAVAAAQAPSRPAS
jgi:adenosylmethionine-8-amino-7-oxononanoate aminotransferase